MKPHERILVALDTPDRERALDLAGSLGGHVGGVKVGLELFTANGPDIVRELRASGVDIFLDLKLHDIPNTVAGAAASAATLGVRYLTVHALGGPEMIRRGVRGATEAAAQAGFPPPVVLAVSILTSHDNNDLRRIGIDGTGREAVVRLVGLAREAGAGGIVCSPLEIAEVRRAFPAANVVVPGIRPAELSVGHDDQARTATPAEAVRAGADRIVIGRPITAASDPVAAAEAITRGIGA